MPKHIQTRESVRNAKSCYSDEKIDALVPPEGNTPRQVAELPISDADRLWGLIYSCGATRRQLVEFACKCARRVRQGAAGLKAIETAEAWLRGEVTAEECYAAAHDAATAAATAARAAAYAAHAATYAAYAASACADARASACADARASACADARAAAYAARAAAANAANAAYVAAYVAACADARAAADAAYTAEQEWQIQTLVEILERDDLQATVAKPPPRPLTPYQHALALATREANRDPRFRLLDIGRPMHDMRSELTTRAINAVASRLTEAELLHVVNVYNGEETL